MMIQDVNNNVSVSSVGKMDHQDTRCKLQENRHMLVGMSSGAEFGNTVPS
jgi:hypothetical protein